MVVSGGKELSTVECLARARVEKPVKPDQLLAVLAGSGSDGTRVNPL